MNEPLPLCCTPPEHAAAHDWYSYENNDGKIVDQEISAIIDQARTELLRDDREAVIDDLREAARLGEVVADKQHVRNMRLGENVYELKAPLDTYMGHTTELRMYMVDIAIDDHPTLGNFLAGTKAYPADAERTRSIQNEQVLAASRRCDERCAANECRRL